MRKFFLIALLLAANVRADEVTDSDRWYSSAAAGLFLPGGGNPLSRAAEVSVRFGAHLTDAFAVECEASSVPNTVSSYSGNTALTGLGTRGLWHFLGYERFDPFLSFGVLTRFGGRHVFADGAHRTSIGPTVGLGALYHLTESWALRADARFTLGCDSPCDVLFDVTVGAQFSFGGGSRHAVVTAPTGPDPVPERAFTIRTAADDAAVLAALAADPAATVELVGHVDCKLGMGRDRARALSEARAEAVRARLVATGVAPARLTVTGAGFSKPCVKFDFRNGAPANDRVEAFLRGGREGLR